MLREFMGAGLAVAILVFSASQAKPNAPATPFPNQSEGISIELGRRDFTTYCAACHGVSATGDGTIAEFLTIAAPDLTKLSKLNSGIFPRDRVQQVIDGRLEVRIHGPRDMPVWGDWFDAEVMSQGSTRETRELIVHDRIESLINYIETLQQN